MWTGSGAASSWKGNKEREVYLGSKARIWLTRYFTERQDADPALWVTERSPHRLSIHGLQGVFKRVAVQSLVGHENPETTPLYAVLDGETRHQGPINATSSNSICRRATGGPIVFPLVVKEFLEARVQQTISRIS